MNDIKLYTVFHKEFYQPSADFVIPIHGGKADGENDLDMFGDDIGESISELNVFFSELTVVYWIVKMKAATRMVLVYAITAAIL